MIILIAFISFFIGLFLERKIGYVSKLLRTQKGEYFFSSLLSIFVTEIVLFCIVALIMFILHFDKNLTELLLGILLGQMLLIAPISRSVE